MLAGLALAGGASVAAFSILQRRDDTPRTRTLHGAEWAAITLFTLFALRAFLWLVFVDHDAIKVLSPNNLGDLSLHLTYIRYLANGTPFWPENPIFAGGSLTYPVGIDLFHSLLALIGADDLRSLIWVGLAGCACTGVALWHWGGSFTLAGFLCNGGVAGFAILHDGRLADFQSELAWKSLPLALFVTQRGLLFALPAGLLLLCSWRTRFFAGAGSVWRLPFWGEVLLYAALPVFHFHTFLFLSILLGVWFVVHAAARRDLVRLIACAFVPATALVLLVTDFFRGPAVLGWQPGWMQGEQNFFAFWFLNFGFFPLFVAALGFLILRGKRSLWPVTTLCVALGVFLLCCFVKFAPWEWDNTKLMLWSYLLVLPLLWSELLAGWTHAVRALACLLLFFSGFVSLLGGLDASHTGHEIARRSELDGVAAAVRDLPITARFIGAPTYNHPLLLVGRKMALGYTGHAWSHGLNWRPVAKQVGAILHGRPEWRELCGKLSVRYLFWGALEQEFAPDSTQPWKEHRPAGRERRMG